jgi:transcription antitermination protein NusB
MINRRNIRIKVMQVLYMLELGLEDGAVKNPVNELQKQFDKSRDLLVYIIHFLVEVSKFAEKDARNRANKHLPSQNDLNVNTKLAGNTLLWEIIELPAYKAIAETVMPQKLMDDYILKNVYAQLVESDEYKLYINKLSRDKHSEKDILKFIFTDLMLANENFTQHIEEKFSNWDDDGEMMNILVNSFLSKPSSANFSQIISADKWQYAKSLMISSFNKRQYLLDLIKPKLKNWDSDRIASIDMILMQMSVCEFLYFETIPIKVTMNEYIDLAKEYSTAQSGTFINGILDSLYKDLAEKEMINKVDFKRK